MTFQSWKYGAKDVPTIEAAKLQWGHDISVMEIVFGVVVTVGKVRASMGP